ncbi:N-acetylmuramoyl-L-alanine amidase family protein [Acutalibacter muris]|uniref:peptidoglycan recognition protein family protein n=1 Tax=Acutalibacter muris TaxID=1796620 RepID=UPI001C3F03DD|nr:N-acetylmuramoyl-L-alanine amidase [Acutalibacter muris]
MNIVKKLCPQERYDIKCPYLREPDRIVVHNTANDAPAANEINYMINRPEEVSFHFAADDTEVVQGLPLERNAWASGDGLGAGNLRGIHVEICYSKSGGERFQRAEENAARLLAELLKERGWGLDRVTKHQDYDGKYCPHRTLDLGWERFLKMVKKYLEQEDNVDYNTFKRYMDRYNRELAAAQVSGWAGESWGWAKENGLLDGSAPKVPLTREQAAAVLSRVLKDGAGT